MARSDILLGYVKASSYRTKIVRSLGQKKLTPAEMAGEPKIPLSHVSNTLTELLEKDLVVCLTPKLRKGRIYDLTKEGRGVLKYLI